MTGPVDRDELVRGKEDVKLDCGCSDPGGFVSLADSTLLEAQFVLPETQKQRNKKFITNFVQTEYCSGGNSEFKTFWPGMLF